MTRTVIRAFVAVLMLVTGAQGVAAQHGDHQEQSPQSEPKVDGKGNRR